MVALRLVVPIVLVAAFLAAAVPVHAQGAADAPPLTVGANKLYCHATTDGLTVWMNKVQDDGDAAPYQLTGEAALTDPVLGVGLDPVVQEAVEAHIPLSPALTETIVVSGTVTAQAFIGSGAYGGGIASLSAALWAGTTELAASEAVDHTMQPHNANLPGGTDPYEEITWTFEVPETPIPAGTPLEWVIKGTIDVGNNVFLACHAARGYSNIDVPVTAVAPAGGGMGGGSDDNATGNATDTSTSASGTLSTTTTTSVSTTSRSSTTTSPSTTADDTTTTGNATSTDEKDSPALPFVALAVGLLVAGVAVRRRLQ